MLRAYLPVHTHGRDLLAPPSTLTCRPAGAVLMVIFELFAAKFAVTVCGEVILTEVDAEVELATLPVQLLNL